VFARSIAILTSYFRRRTLDRAIDDEFALHLELRADDLVRSGMSRDGATRRARMEFGSVTAAKERAREAWRWTWLEQFGQDLRYALRGLRKNPVFATVAVLSLALGIGANTAMFSINDALIFRALPVRKPDQLVRVTRADNLRQGLDQFSYAQFQDLRSSHAFAGVTAIAHLDRSNVTASGRGGGLDPSAVHVELVSGEYFQTLGVGSVRGRTLGPDDDRVRDGEPVVVISYAYWQRRFALASDVVGRTLSLSGTTYTIIGVTPSGFFGEWVGRPTDMWLPLAMQSEAMPDRPGLLDRLASRGWLEVMIGRLKPGESRRQAEATADASFNGGRRARGEDAAANRSAEGPPRIMLLSGARGFSSQRAYFGASLTILAALAGTVLIIACANLASLLLARSASRQREVALRLAIGASRGRIARQLLTEHALLAIAGGVLGVLFATWGSSALSASLASGPPRMASIMSVRVASLNAHLDMRGLSFTVATCVLATIGFGLLPAMRGSRVAVAPALIGRGAVGAVSGGRFRLGKIVVIGQVALALLLLAGAGLFTRSLWHLRSQDLGLDERHTLLVWTSPEQSGKVRAALVPLFQTVQRRLSSLPGVIAVAPATQGLLDGGVDGGMSERMRIEGREAPAGLKTRHTVISPDYFKVVGIPVLRGREFTDQDTEGSRPVVIITDNLARLYFGDDEPIGKQLKLSPDTSLKWTEIVGVVKAGAYWSPFNPQLGIVFVPYRQAVSQREPMLSMIVLVRSAGDPMALATRIRAELRAIDANLPVVRIDSVKQQLDDLLINERLLANLAATFGALSALLACLGLYGVVAYTTARRTSEIGIRMALGATRGRVLTMVLREGLVLVLVGIAIGVPAAFGGARLVTHRLFGVGAGDPLTFVAAATLMVCIAAIASLIPARRAASVDAMVALRIE
jgi:predicted permease